MTPNTNTREHLEESILLAYLRRQKLEDGLSLRITRHIDIERCRRCRHKLDELAQISVTLDVLGRMPSYQHYPELSVDDTYARAQGAASKRTSSQADLYPIRQRPRKSAVRLVSLPVAVALTMLFTVVIAFASLSGRTWIPGSSPGGTSSSQPNATSFPRQQSTATPNLALTVTASNDASATPTSTATPVTGPYIAVCSTSNNIANWRLVICGYNFEVGYKVTLVAFGKTPAWLPTLPVNKQGNFQVGWNIGNCRNLPTTIIAYEYEKANVKPIIVRLRNISFGSCPLPTPTVGPPGITPGG